MLGYLPLILIIIVNGNIFCESLALTIASGYNFHQSISRKMSHSAFFLVDITHIDMSSKIAFL